MTSLPFWTVDAFSSHTFGGNPAGVCLLKEVLPDKVLLQVAGEVALSETCFIRPLDGDKGARWSLRWFTPTNEVKLCGHGTMASATVLFRELGLTVETIHFITLSGELTAKRQGDVIELVLPSYPGVVSSKFDRLAQASACTLPIKEVLWSPELAYLTVVLADSVTREQLESVAPPTQDFPSLEPTKQVAGLTLTCPGDQTHDFYSRHFDPWQGIPEDPVTGSAHSVLAPYWGKRLAKTKMLARLWPERLQAVAPGCSHFALATWIHRQCSKRGGSLEVTLEGDSLLVRGNAVTVIRGTLSISV